MKVRFPSRAGAAALASALLLIGCVEGGGARSSGGTADSIKVVMARYSDATQPFWTGVVKEFEQQHPDIDVRLQVVGWNTLLQQVPTWTQTRTLPDVLNFNAFSKFAAADLLHPVSDVASQSLRADIVDTLAANGKLDGTAYAIPFIASVRTLGYNKQILSEIGAQPPKTWEELAQVAVKAKEAGYTGYCLPLGSEEAQGEWSLWAWANGGGWKKGGKCRRSTPNATSRPCGSCVTLPMT